MTTPDRPLHPGSAPTAPTPHSRGSLRLRMAEPTDTNRLAGGWWPRSRDLATELADLVEHFPVEHGRVIRALYSPPDWDGAPRRVPLRTGYLKVGYFPADDTHTVDLTMSDRRVLRVLVVPPDYSASQGAEALLAASTTGNEHSGPDVLAVVTEHPDVDPADHWSDDGGSWWGDTERSPSYRAPSGTPGR